MNDTDIINERMAQMRRERMEAEEAERNKPRRTVEDLIRESREREAQTKQPSEPIITEPRLSKYRGVCFFKLTGQWTANIKDKGKRYTKYLETEIGAAKEYDRLAVKFKGENAITNFPIENYEMPEPKPKPAYEDRDVVVNTAQIRSAMEMWVSAKPPKYRSTRLNWQIFTDLFFPEAVPEKYLELCREWGIEPGGSEL